MGFTLAEKGGDSTRWSPLTDDLSDPANFDLCSAADPDLCTNSPEGLLSGLFDAQHINQDAQSAADPTPPSDGELAHLVYTVAALLVVTLLWWAIAALVSRAARRVRRLRGSASQDSSYMADSLDGTPYGTPQSYGVQGASPYSYAPSHGHSSPPTPPPTEWLRDDPFANHGPVTHTPMQQQAAPMPGAAATPATHATHIASVAAPTPLDRNALPLPLPFFLGGSRSRSRSRAAAARPHLPPSSQNGHHGNHRSSCSPQHVAHMQNFTPHQDPRSHARQHTQQQHRQQQEQDMGDEDNVLLFSVPSASRGNGNAASPAQHQQHHSPAFAPSPSPWSQRQGRGPGTGQLRQRQRASPARGTHQGQRFAALDEDDEWHEDGAQYGSTGHRGTGLGAVVVRWWRRVTGRTAGAGVAAGQAVGDGWGVGGGGSGGGAQGWDPALLQRQAALQHKICSVEGLLNSVEWQEHVRNTKKRSHILEREQTQAKLRLYQDLRRMDPDAFARLLTRTDIKSYEVRRPPLALLLADYVLWRLAVPLWAALHAMYPATQEATLLRYVPLALWLLASAVLAGGGHCGPLGRWWGVYLAHDVGSYDPADGGKAGGADGDADGEEDEAEWGNGWECLAGPWRHLLLLVCELGLAATSLGLLAAAAVGMMALSRRRQTPAMWLLGLRHEMELERTTTLSPYSPSPQRAARPGGPVRYGLMTPLRAPSPLRPGPTPHRAGPTSMQRNWQH